MRSMALSDSHFRIRGELHGGGVLFGVCFTFYVLDRCGVCVCGTFVCCRSSVVCVLLNYSLWRWEMLFCCCCCLFERECVRINIILLSTSILEAHSKHTVFHKRLFSPPRRESIFPL